MSVSYRGSRDKHGDQVVTITITGEMDIHRFAFNLLSQQVEFGRLGRRILRAQRRRFGKARWARAWVQLHGTATPPMTFYWGRDDA